MEREMESKAPSIIDLNAEAAKLTMFYGRTPQTTFRERRGSAAQLALYRDGFLLLSKFASHCTGAVAGACLGRIGLFRRG